MSEPRGQAEPSMEEILASIRRIISQETQEARDGGSDRKPGAPATPAAASHPPPGNGDVLLLTEMVAADGSVVSLADARAAAGRGPVAAPEAGGGASASPVVPFGAPEAAGAAAGGGAVSERNTPDDQEVERPSVTSETEKKEGLVSRESRAAAAAAFSELTRQVAREREAPVDGGRTVEELVREALQPMLKNWLDTHLPTMVERVVRQEIQRVARQAEDIG
jgi:cell pole-organizing protein PopZ